MAIEQGQEERVGVAQDQAVVLALLVVGTVGVDSWENALTRNDLQGIHKNWVQAQVDWIC